MTTVGEMNAVRRRILRFLWLHGRPPLAEKSASSDELAYLANTARRTDAQRICEIGFNAGYSSYAFLSANPSTEVVSFDLGEHGYTRTAKKLIDKEFPGRHTLVYGDSTKTVPEYRKTHLDETFDLVFIDGGHDYAVAKADIVNMEPFCTTRTVVIMDDLTPWQAWGEGPAKAWTEAITEGLVTQDELYKDGEPVDVLEPPGKRIWASGRYLK